MCKYYHEELIGDVKFATTQHISLTVPPLDTSTSRIILTGDVKFATTQHISLTVPPLDTSTSRIILTGDVKFATTQHISLTVPPLDTSTSRIILTGDVKFATTQHISLTVPPLDTSTSRIILTGDVKFATTQHISLTVPPLDTSTSRIILTVGRMAKHDLQPDGSDCIHTSLNGARHEDLGSIDEEEVDLGKRISLIKMIDSDVLLAGNHMKNLQHNLNMAVNNQTTILCIFTSDAKKVFSVLKFNFLLILGVRQEHWEVDSLKGPAKKEQIVVEIRKAFVEINSHIRDANKLDNLILFYSTGYGCMQNRLCLGSKNETINATTDRVKEILHQTSVDQLYFIHDCCHDTQQNFAKKTGESRVGILQFLSCDNDEKALYNEHDLKGIYCNHFLCQGLQGHNFVKSGDGHFIIKLFRHCNNEKSESSSCRSHCKEFHLYGSVHQSVTLSSVKEYIERHFKLQGLQVKLEEIATDAEEIQLGYYGPEKSSIPINLKECQKGDMYSFRVDPETMPGLKQSIIIYTDKSGESQKEYDNEDEIAKDEESINEADEDKDEIGKGNESEIEDSDEFEDEIEKSKESVNEDDEVEDNKGKGNESEIEDSDEFEDEIEKSKESVNEDDEVEDNKGQKKTEVNNYFLDPWMLWETTQKEFVFPVMSQMENSSLGEFLPSTIFCRLLVCCAAYWPIAKENISDTNKRKGKIRHRLLQKPKKSRSFHIVYGKMDFLHCERTMNKISSLKYRKSLDYLRHGHKIIRKFSTLQTLSKSSSLKLRLIPDFFTYEQVLSQSTHREILDHLCNGQEMSMISYYRFKSLLNSTKQYLQLLIDDLPQNSTHRTIYNPFIEKMGKVTQELIGPAMVSKNDNTSHSMRSHCLEEEEAQYYSHKCGSNSKRLSSANVKNPKLSATDNQGFISVSVPVKEDLPRHKKKTRSPVVQDLNVSERDTGDLSLTCRQRNLEDAIQFADSVRTSVKNFFKTKDITFDQGEDSGEGEKQIQYGVDDLAPKEKVSAVIDERNVRDIDLKEKKKSLLHAIICPSINQLPQPSLSRDAIVGFVEGESQIAELREILKQIASDEILEPQITMKYDMLRLCTMKHFPGRDRPFAIRITGAGFYYAGHQDQVICYCCGSCKDNWIVGDIPLLIHQNMAPNCSFLTDNATVNVPIRKANSTTSVKAEVRLHAIQISDGSNQSDTAHGESSLMVPSSEQYQFKVSSGTHQMLVTNKSSTPNQQISSGGQNVLASQQIPSVHAFSVEDPPPKYPQYAVKNMRINSFQGWSADLRQKPEEMAECGFYYAGFSDCVRCFYCGVGLRHWMSEDDPWIEHARWSTSCVYVCKMKGEEFVSLVRMAVEIAEREEAARNNGGANHPPQNNSETAPINTEKEDFHCNNSTNSNTARDSACSTGTTVGGATASTPSHGNAEIQKYLLTDAAQSVLDMGYQPKMVLRAIEKVLMTKGTEELTGQIIMEALFEIEEQNKPKSQHQPSPQSAQETESSTKANDNDEESNKQDRKQDGEAAEGGTGEGLQIDPEKIRREHRELREVTLCKICLDNTSSVVFLPCGHLVTCPDCAPAMRKCPICRTLIKGTVKTFFG